MAADVEKHARNPFLSLSQYRFKLRQSHGDDGSLTLWRRRRGFCYKFSNRSSCVKDTCEVLRDCVSSAGSDLVAGFAVPDTDGGALDAVLSAELAHVAGVLCDLHGVVSECFSRLRSSGRAHLHLLDLLTERGTVTGTVLSGNSDLLCACIAINMCLVRKQ